MGFTRYWHRPKAIKADVFKAIRLDIEQVAQALKDEYELPMAGPDGEGKPIFSNQLIIFNGLKACVHKGDLNSFGRCCDCAGDSCLFDDLGCSHEDFVLERVYEPWLGQKPGERVITYGSRRPRKTLYGCFCKTERKPYDIFVASALLIMKRHLGNSVIVRSDGGEDDFTDAKILCLGRLGYGDEYILDERDGLIRGYFQMSDAIADANLAVTQLEEMEQSQRGAGQGNGEDLRVADSRENKSTNKKENDVASPPTTPETKGDGSCS